MSISERLHFASNRNAGDATSEPAAHDPGHAYWVTPELIDSAPYSEISDQDLENALGAIQELLTAIARDQEQPEGDTAVSEGNWPASS